MSLARHGSDIARGNWATAQEVTITPFPKRIHLKGNVLICMAQGGQGQLITLDEAEIDMHPFDGAKTVRPIQESPLRKSGDFIEKLNLTEGAANDGLEKASAGAAGKLAAEDLAATGWRLWQQRKLAEAEAAFKKSLDKNPDNANTWNGLGWAQFNQGKPLNAKKAFEEALTREPKHAAALNGLGWIAKGEGKTDEAIACWKRAVEAVPEATAALAGLARTYMEQKNYKDAVQIYEQWLKAEPNNAEAKQGLEKARAGAVGKAPTFSEADLKTWLARLDDPNAPPFEALNVIIRMGPEAVPGLIETLKTNGNWQVPKALGAIGDKRATLPLIEKLETNPASPMKEVIGEALESITGQKFGADPAAWRKWWDEQNP